MRKFDKSYFLLILPTLYVSSPYFAYRMRSLIPCIFILVWFIFQRRRRSMFAANQKLTASFIYACLMFVLCYFSQNIPALFGHGDFTQYFRLASYIGHFAFFIVVHYSLKYDKVSELKFLTCLALSGLVMAGVSALYGKALGIEVGRVMTTSLEVIKDAGLSNNMYQDKMISASIGAAGYSMTYTYALLIGPIIFAVFKMKMMYMKIFMCAVALSLLTAVRYSGLGTPVFVVVVSCVLFLIFCLSKSNKTVIGAGSIMAIGLLIFASFPSLFSFLSSPLNKLAELFEYGSSIHERILSVAKGVRGDIGTYAVARFRLQLLSWNTFLENPIFGVGRFNPPHITYDTLVGGHSELLDALAQEGIFRGIFFVGFFTSTYRYMRLISRNVLCVDIMPMWSIYMGSYIFAMVANPIHGFSALSYLLFIGISLYFKEYHDRHKQMSF